MRFLIPLIALVACTKESPRPPILKYKKSAMRSEVPVNLKGIKTAQLVYESEFDIYISAKPYPPQSSGATLKPWDESQAEGFSSVGWTPDGNVRGTYWVTTTSTDFTAYGIIDVDGDGQFATYVATKSQHPNTPMTGPNVY